MFTQKVDYQAEKWVTNSGLRFSQATESFLLKENYDQQRRASALQSKRNLNQGAIVNYSSYITPYRLCTGCPRVTTPNEDRDLAVTAKKNRRSTASDLSRQLSSATGTTVSRQTVYRCLEHISLYARRPFRCVPLTANHCRLRLTWSTEHALWTPQR
ncbi:transposable element Tcb1 transposase [Trichonephila clavipes]|nr:transposable element Tcb1 transposase [Trichonephila clavipes]